MQKNLNFEPLGCFLFLLLLFEPCQKAFSLHYNDLILAALPSLESNEKCKGNEDQKQSNLYCLNLNNTKKTAESLEHSLEEDIALQIERIKIMVGSFSNDNLSIYSLSVLKQNLFNLAMLYYSAATSDNENFSNCMIKATMLYSAVFQIEKSYPCNRPDLVTEETFNKVQQEYLKGAFHTKKLPCISRFKEEIEMIRYATLEEINKARRKRNQNFEEINYLYLKISEKCAKKTRNFYKNVFERCLLEVGAPSCNFAFIVFGSLANISATPYSDLEFAILLDNLDKNGEEFSKEEQKKHKEYFRKLSFYINLKLIALNETVLPFNQFGFSLDFLMRSGISFDLGGKTPISRKKNALHRIDIQKNKCLYSLIGTPKEISKYINTNFFNNDKLLPIVVALNDFLYGYRPLHDIFALEIKSYFNSVAFSYKEHKFKTSWKKTTCKRS